MMMRSRVVGWLAAIAFLCGVAWSAASGQETPALWGAIIGAFILTALFFTTEPSDW